MSSTIRLAMCSSLALEPCENRFLSSTRLVDAGVATRHRVTIDLDVSVGTASDYDLAARQRKSLPHIGTRWRDEDQADLALILAGLTTEPW
jgi:hypothetical protein